MQIVHAFTETQNEIDSVAYCPSEKCKLKYFRQVIHFAQNYKTGDSGGIRTNAISDW